MELAGAAVLVTGASSGIGAALARSLAECGVGHLGLVGRDSGRLAEVAHDCRAVPVATWVMDLGDLAAVDRLATEAWDRLGPVDVLVNNAAIPKRRGVLELTDDEIEEVMRVNFHSPVRLARRLLPDMIDRGRGLVVNVSSLGGRLGILNETAYSASKFALTGWTEAAALDLWHEPVDVRLVTPGAIDTAIWSRPDNDEPHFDLDMASPQSVADDIVASIADDGPFEVYTPDMSAIVEFKMADIAAFQAGTIATQGRGLVKALVFGVDPGPVSVPKKANRLQQHLASTPMAVQSVPDPDLRGDDWLVLRTRLCGICGSDSKQVLMDFDDSADNIMTALISFPQVLGHEVVATVAEIGRAVDDVAVGDRVVLYPSLGCGPRGLAPPCSACAAGDFTLCHRFTEGDLEPGIHTGNSRDATGGFAELLPAHRSMVIPVPSVVSDEVAVLADPFSVSLHAVTRNPPPPGGRALVYGAGALGTSAIAVLQALHPDVEVMAVARWDAQRTLAGDLGAVLTSNTEPDVVVEEVAAWSGGVLHQPWEGLPFTHPGGVDVVYDTVGSPESIEAGIRLLATRGSLVQLGVSSPGRFEWTPWYFKELRLVGSNAFGLETVEGERAHAMEHYLALVQAGRVDLSAMLTHTFRLDDWREAFDALATQYDTGAIKVAFDYR